MNRLWVPFKLIANNSDHWPNMMSQLSIVEGLQYKMVSLTSRKMQFSFRHKTCTLDEDIERIHEEMKENIH